MAKKNTLLYLDEETVQQAKAERLNLSEVAENAIKYELMLARTRFKPEKALEEAKKLYLPLQIESFSVRNLGPIQSFSTTLSRAVVLIGPNGSGKTLLLKKLYEAYTDPEPHLPGILRVKNAGVATPGSGCVIFDDFLDRIPEQYHHPVIELAKKKYKQVIFTSSRADYWDLLNVMAKQLYQLVELPTVDRDKRVLKKERSECDYEIERLRIKQRKIDKKLNELEDN